MDKKLVLLVLLILCGCSNNKVAACSYSKENSEVFIDIKAINDNIDSIKVRTYYEIPNSVICDEEKYSFLLSQLDDRYHFEDNKLVKEEELPIEDNYSFELTKDYLRSMRYYCD